MLKVLELYSGIGGMHYALLESGIKGQIVASIDINTNANAVYKFNFPETLNLNRNIQKVAAKEIEKLDINAIFMSPPCQPFTRVGRKRDKQDERTSSLFHVLNLISQIPSIEYVLVENVRGFESSDTRDEMISCLKTANFNFKEFLLSPCQFGIPNSRQRYYLIGKKKHLSFIFTMENLIESIPEFIENILPENKHKILAEQDGIINSRNERKCYSLKYIMESDVSSEYNLPLEIIKKRWSVLDIRNTNSNGSCCFTKAYSHFLEGTGSLFSPLKQDKIVHILKEMNNLDKSDEEFSRLLCSLNLRYFTPREISRLMCFPDKFAFPDGTTLNQKYKLLGNSLNVFVVSRLICMLCCENETI